MSLTTADLQTSLAYRLGEPATPSDPTTLSQRLEWINQGYLLASRRRNWWWQEAVDESNINTGSTDGYPEPSDLKEFIELKVGNVYYDQIPYRQNRTFAGAGATVTLPQLRSAYMYYRFGGNYYFIPTDGSDSLTHKIKYWQRVSKVASGGTFLIPDEYLEALGAYAEGRYWLSIGEQAKAVVPFQEFEEVIKEMATEQGRRGNGSKGFGIAEPEDIYY